MALLQRLSGRHASAVEDSACATQHVPEEEEEEEEDSSSPAPPPPPTMREAAAAAAALGAQHAVMPEVRSAQAGSLAEAHMNGTMFPGIPLGSGMLQL